MANYIEKLADDQHWPAEIRVYETIHIQDKEPSKNLISVVPFCGDMYGNEDLSADFFLKISKVVNALHDAYSTHCDGIISIEVKAEYDFVNG